MQELEARFGTGKGAEGIVMDVNTGAVLAMASLPTYDLNSPGTVYNDFLTSGMTEEQVLENMRDLLNKQWRSKAINDTYEPGSTFKTLTLAMALEENVVDLNTGFYCSGSVKIEGETINCSKRAPGHGQQNLTQAFANSCNPAFINIGLRIGNDKFYQYMLDFGLTEKTGIDTTGEASGFVNSEIKYSTLALACYAFGQNFNVTPIALLAAQCACVNGGYLYTPYLAEEITDQDGNVVSKHDSTPIRQVVSEETSALVRDIMEYEVTSGTGKNGQVAGYRIGGKSGTSEQLNMDRRADGDYKKVASFAAVLPANDPEILVYVMLDDPNNARTDYSSILAAPVVGNIISEVAPYLGLATDGVDRGQTSYKVPNLIGQEWSNAQVSLNIKGLKHQLMESSSDQTAAVVTYQYPRAGAEVPYGTTIYLYTDTYEGSHTEVPDVSGKSAEFARQMLAAAGLNCTVEGDANGLVQSQSEAPGTSVQRGTIVTITCG